MQTRGLRHNARIRTEVTRASRLQVIVSAETFGGRSHIIMVRPVALIVVAIVAKVAKLQRAPGLISFPAGRLEFNHTSQGDRDGAGLLVNVQRAWSVITTCHLCEGGLGRLVGRWRATAELVDERGAQLQGRRAECWDVVSIVGTVVFEVAIVPLDHLDMGMQWDTDGLPWGSTRRPAVCGVSSAAS
jgi:hypothetical protein